MNKLVLIADDYDHIAVMLAQAIAALTSYETMAALDGAEAIAKANARRPDVAILDIDMPRINGIEAARAIREMYPDNPPHLVACTASPITDELAQTGLFDLILRKPAGLDNILRVLKIL